MDQKSRGLHAVASAALAVQQDAHDRRRRDSDRLARNKHPVRQPYVDTTRCNMTVTVTPRRLARTTTATEGAACMADRSRPTGLQDEGPGRQGSFADVVQGAKSSCSTSGQRGAARARRDSGLRRAAGQDQATSSSLAIPSMTKRRQSTRVRHRIQDELPDPARRRARRCAGCLWTNLGHPRVVHHQPGRQGLPQAHGHRTEGRVRKRELRDVKLREKTQTAEAKSRRRGLSPLM